MKGMKSLAAKEIRQLLPVYATALLLAIAPAWLHKGWTPNGDYADWTFPLLCFGMLLLALSTAFPSPCHQPTMPLGGGAQFVCAQRLATGSDNTSAEARKNPRRRMVPPLVCRIPCVLR